MEGLFRRLGIADEIKPKLKQTQPGNPVGEVSRAAKLEIGFQQVSELLPIAGIDYIGPAASGHPTYHRVLGRHPYRREAAGRAKALVKFITAPAAVPVIKKKGMEPG